MPRAEPRARHDRSLCRRHDIPRCRSSSVAPADMAQQSALLKEDQLRREEEKLKEIELRVQREILQRKQELSRSS